MLAKQFDEILRKDANPRFRRDQQAQILRRKACLGRLNNLLVYGHLDILDESGGERVSFRSDRLCKCLHIDTGSTIEYSLSTLSQLHLETIKENI